MQNAKNDFVPTTPEVEEFARILIQHVRDAAIRNCDLLVKPDVTAVTARRWRKAIRSGSPELLAREAIPDIVDATLFFLLFAIDDGLLRLSYTARNGRVVDLNTDGERELAGWYVGKGDGWLPLYSKERFVDDFSSIQNPPNS
jgi:hypothetical protein